jgi:hypothetical protein
MRSFFLAGTMPMGEQSGEAAQGKARDRR